MLVNTKHFGEIEVDEKGIIDFRGGLPGFEKIKKYILLTNSDKESPFKWLQSIEEKNLAFAVIDPFVIKKDYDIEVSDETVENLDIENLKDVMVLSIVVIPEDISKTSINLKAPLIINVNRKKGMQVILDTDLYTVRHYIVEELRKQEVIENACTDKEERSVHCNK